MRRKRSENTVLKDGFKLCCECKEEKPETEFSIRNTGKLYAYCKPCNSDRTKRWTNGNKERKSANAKVWRDNNKEKLREDKKRYYLQRTYGLSPDCVSRKLAEQNSRCAICETDINEGTLVVDHCHGFGHVRDLLCNLCNISLGPIEREGFLEKALAYLERHRSAG